MNDARKISNRKVKNQDRLEYSVVVPVMNEEGNVEILYNRITEALKSMGKPYEIIMVDDGSNDKTYEILKSIHQRDKCLKVVKFRRNYGQSAAMAAGFERVKGCVVISMDGDLQNDPKDIPSMIAKLREGYDVVAGWRKNRKDKMLIRKVPSKIANKIIRFFTGVQLHDTGCSLKVYKADIIRRIRLYGEMHRFIPALARIEGARITEMAVDHHARQFGESKYNLTRTFRVIMDLTTLNLFIKYLTKPIHFFGTFGVLLNLVGVAALTVYGYLRLVNSPESASVVLIAFAFLMLTSGFLFIFYGLIASMVVGTGEKQNNQLMDYFSKRLN